MLKNTTLTAEDVIHYLNHLARRTKIFRMMHPDLLGTVLADGRRILEQRKEEESLEREKNRQHQEKVENHLTALLDAGIEIDELKNLQKKRTKKAQKKPSIGKKKKYVINGVSVSYKGVGKYPGILREIIDKEGLAALDAYEVID